MLRMRRSLLFAVSLFAGLAAISGCGGGGGGSSITAKTTGTMNVYVTDAWSDNYSQVLLTLYKIEGSTNGTTYTTLFSDANGQTEDLVSLKTVDQMLASVSVPAGTYTSIRVTTGDQITVTPKGSTTSTTIPVDMTAPNVTCSASECAVTFTTNQIVTSQAISNLSVDFNLAAFELVGGRIRLALQTATATSMQNKTYQARLTGTVASLTAGTGFSLQEPGGNTVQVTLSSTTAIFSATSGTNVTLANGQNVEVEGALNPTTNTITAEAVQILNTSTTTNIAVFGTVATAGSSTTNTFTVTVQAAEHFTPSAGTLTVQTNANTVFFKPFTTNVTITDVTASAPVIVTGSYDSSTMTLTAKRVNIY